MKTAIRYDRGILERLDGDGAFPRFRVTFMKSGVLDYQRADGSISKEAKFPSEISSKDTIDTLRGAPITSEHPLQFVSMDNAKELAKGIVMDSIKIENKKDGTEIKGSAVLYDQKLVDSIQSGEKREVSIGFTSDLEVATGTLDGKKFDAVQRNIRINHVAATTEGRAGKDVSFHLDSKNADDVAVQVRTDSENKGSKMKKKDVEHEEMNNDQEGEEGEEEKKGTDQESEEEKAVDQEPEEEETSDQEGEEKKVAAVAEAVSANLPDKSTPEQELEKMKTENARLFAEVAALGAILSEREMMIAKLESPESVDSAVKDRMNILEIAESAIEGFDSKGKTNRKIMIEVANKILPSDVKLDSKSKLYLVKARFDAAAEVARTIAQGVDVQGEIKNDGGSVEDKRARRMNMRAKKVEA